MKIKIVNGDFTVEVIPNKKAELIRVFYELYQQCGTAAVSVIYKGYTVETDYKGVLFVRHNNKAKTFKRLGNALNYIEKLKEA